MWYGSYGGLYGAGLYGYGFSNFYGINGCHAIGYPFGYFW